MRSRHGATVSVRSEPVPGIELDHLVVAARTLAAGRAWCEATFGVAPEPGGRHLAMATHNVLLALSSSRFARAYLEIIAIDPDAAPPTRRRWFDLDSEALQAAISGSPRLVHWVARTDDIETAAAALRGLGHEPGVITDAERMTPSGLLRWRITLPADGCRPAAGAVPLLIEWRDRHPSETLTPSGAAIESLRVGGVTPKTAQVVGASLQPGPAATALTSVVAARFGPVVLDAVAAP